MDNHQQTFKNIDKMYDKLTYADKYGTSIFLFVILSLLVFLGVSYSIVMINLQPIQADWIHYRCKPYIIPFAGIVNKPEDTSAIDYTSQNFQYCMQNIIKDVTGEAVQPITFVVNILNSMANIIKEAINAIRNMLNKVRTQIQSVTQEVMGRLGNLMVPLQQIIISMRDLLSKVQGLMTASLFTLLGGYYTLQSLMGAIAQFIITILIALAATIAVLWIVPFTWATASSMTVIFIAIAIPMAMILDFMLEYLHVTPDIQIPTIQCFDEDTLIQMEDGSFKKIVNIQIGEKLMGGNKVNTKIKVDASRSQMYNLDDILVSDSHLVKYGEKWVRVSQHPYARKVAYYNKPYLYCLNTNLKIIQVGGYCFSDWDEMVDKKYMVNDFDVHKYLNSGLDQMTRITLQNEVNKIIRSVQIGDVLSHGEKVIGIVELDGLEVYEHYLMDLGIHGEKIVGGGHLCFLTPDLEKTRALKYHKEKRLFHLLTDTQTFWVNNVQLKDYNGSVDEFLESCK
jgi:hypothetical protein